MKLIITLLLLTSVLNIQAAPRDCLDVYFSDGSYVTFPLDQSPRMTFDGKTVHIANQHYQISNIRKYTISDSEYLSIKNRPKRLLYNQLFSPKIVEVQRKRRRWASAHPSFLSLSRGLPLLFSDERLPRDAAEAVFVGVAVGHPYVPQVLHLAAYLIGTEHIVDGCERPEEVLPHVPVLRHSGDAPLECDFVDELHAAALSVTTCHSRKVH